MALQLTGKTIADPLYGNVHLTEIESKLVSTRAFQRLHNVRQLGLGHLVFPSAGYSRFSHSVGACFNADRILTAIELNAQGKKFSDAERQAFRIAALFHDLGHYPFSHATEHAIKRFFRQGIYRSEIDDSQGVFDIISSDVGTPKFFDHEDNGKFIFQEDVEINRAFEECPIVSKDDVTSVFINENLSTIISSDLDCDRLDYLKRTSIHSGSPYGSVDVDFIISKSTLDDNGRFCFGQKATRAADHLLVSRFYDFMQIPYHKTVAALEWSLEESVIYLLKRRIIKLGETDVQALLVNGRWANFDDGAITEMLRRAYLRSGGDEVDRDHIAAVLYRKPAKVIFSWEMLTDVTSAEMESKEKLLEYKIKEAAEKKGLDPRRFFIWKAPFKLAKAGPMLQGPEGCRDYSDEEQQQLIHILRKDNGTSVPLIDLQNAVSHHLSKLRYRVLRVYFLLSENFPLSLKDELREIFSDV